MRNGHNTFNDACRADDLACDVILKNSGVYGSFLPAGKMDYPAL